VKALVQSGQLEMGHARALLALQGGAQLQAARHVVAKGLSVRETERFVKRLMTSPSRPTRKKVDPDIRRLEQELSEKLGAEVCLEDRGSGKGRLVIRYNSLAELDGILAKIH
ncbi:MAG: chromosome partitioning protein ParB, partial [Gammaproteobacteria bacterium]